MQGKKELTPKMLYQVQLQDLIPEHNYYRLLDKAIDFRFLYKATKDYYGAEGQESIDPVVFFKICLVGYLNNINSDRKHIEYCSKQGGNKAKLLFKEEKTDSKGYTKRTYRSSESDCRKCQFREQCCGMKTNFKKLDDSIHKELYDKMHKKRIQNPEYAKRMSKIRSKTVEPVLGHSSILPT